MEPKSEFVKHYFDLEPKSEISEGLDLKADEAFADITSMGMATNLRRLLDVYGNGMMELENNLKAVMKLEGFADKLTENESSN